MERMPSSAASLHPAAGPAAVRPRAAAFGRPADDPRCAGCAQLGTFRALRRAGLAVRGGLGCDPGARHVVPPSGARWAEVAGARRVRGAGARGLLRAAARDGAALVVVGDIGDAARALRLAATLRAAGAETVVVDPHDLADAEEAVARAARGPSPVAVVALAPCVRVDRPWASLRVAASRCNRCGACLGLACPAIRDDGGEAVVIDPGVCTGCGLCSPLCRAGAIDSAR
jgi:Pyruvate/2-oxoacid:ferredoxin oxidoreductase delta subunit